MAYYFVAVSLSEDDGCKNNRWTVTRKLSEFQALHRKLTEVQYAATPLMCDILCWRSVSNTTDL